MAPQSREKPMTLSQPSRCGARRLCPHIPSLPSALLLSLAGELLARRPILLHSQCGRNLSPSTQWLMGHKDIVGILAGINAPVKIFFRPDSIMEECFGTGWRAFIGEQGMHNLEL